MADPIFKADESIQLKRQIRYRRRMKFIGLILLILIIGLAAFLYAITRKHSTNPQVGPSYTKTIAGPTLYKSQFFEFRDTAKWVYEPHDSGPNEVTFLQYQGGVLAYSVSVYVNQAPSIEELPVEYALPVQIVDQKSFSVGNITPQCGSAYAPTDKRLQKVVSIGGTNIMCFPGSPEYHVEAGQVGGNYNLVLRRSNGQLATYVIIYKDLTTSPEATPFINFLQTFQAL